MEQYKTCEQCGGTGKGKKMLDLDRYHQCPTCAGRGKYYDVTSVMEMIPGLLFKRHNEVMSKIYK